MIFSPTHSSFYSLKFIIFYSFFIQIKVKHPNLKKNNNNKIRELLKFSIFSPHVYLIFLTQTFLYITTPFSNTNSKKKLLISKIYYFYLFEIYIYFKLYICNFLKSCRMPPSICPCPLESVITFYFIFGKHKYILFLVTKVFVVVIFFLSPRQVEALFR